MATAIAENLSALLDCQDAKAEAPSRKSRRATSAVPSRTNGSTGQAALERFFLRKVRNGQHHSASENLALKLMNVKKIK